MTLDIKPMWLNVIRSIQAAACRNNGAAIVTIKVMVDENGDPQFWTKPDITIIEPKRCAEQVLSMADK